MNQKMLLLSAFSLLALTQTVSAQQQQQQQHHQWRPIFGGRKTDPITQGILQRQLPHPVQRGTGVTDRLTGWAIDYGTGNDSAWYKYNSTAHGSMLDNNVLNTYLETGYDPTMDQQMPYPLAVSRSAPASKYDTAYTQYIEDDTVRSASRIGRTFSANNNLLSERYRARNYYSGMYFDYASKMDFTYDGTGNLSSALSYQDTSAALNGGYMMNAATLYSFSGGRIAKDSTVNYYIGAAQPYQNVTYSYDGSGNMSQAVIQTYNGSSYDYEQKDSYTYTAGNKLATHLSQSFSAGWQNSSIDSFSYQGNNLAYSSSYIWDDNTGTWDDGYVTNSYYNASGNLDSQLNYNVLSSANMPESKITYTYNAYNHYNRLMSFPYTGTGYSTTPDATLQFYYETYTPTGISPVAQPGRNASLFPNPADGQLNIRFAELPKGGVTIRIYNMAGQLVQQAAGGAVNILQVPVGSLVPGSYTIEVADGNAAQHLSFIKR